MQLFFERRIIPKPVVEEPEVVTIPTRRRIITTSVSDWEDIILRHLKPSNRWMYGHLSKIGDLFTIRSLSTVRVPKEVIDKMLSNKQIALGEDDYYYVIENNSSTN